MTARGTSLDQGRRRRGRVGEGEGEIASRRLQRGGGIERVRCQTRCQYRNDDLEYLHIYIFGLEELRLSPIGDEEYFNIDHALPSGSRM